jgi:energy-coupling factor transporter ATP-binding protein EcfA2
MLRSNTYGHSLALEIEISNFSYSYGMNSPRVLSSIAMTVPKGKICALLGPTNAGKTTLLQALSGVLGSHHHEGVGDGSIQIGSEMYSPLPQNVLFPTVGLTIQEPFYQISGFRETVHEEILLTLEALGMTGVEADARISDVEELLGISHLSARKPSTLSGGELQRVALATMLVARPPVLLMDEPCNSLDGIAQQRMILALHALKGMTTVIFTDCKIDFALRTADVYFVLEGGRIVFSGSRSQFLRKLPEFRSVLPVDQWIPTLSAATLSTHHLRLLERMGLR